MGHVFLSIAGLPKQLSSSPSGLFTYRFAARCAVQSLFYSD